MNMPEGINSSQESRREDSGVFDASLTLAAVDAEIKKINKQLNQGSLNLKEAIARTTELQQKRVEVKQGTELADSVLEHIKEYKPVAQEETVSESLENPEQAADLIEGLRTNFTKEYNEVLSRIGALNRQGKLSSEETKAYFLELQNMKQGVDINKKGFLASEPTLKGSLEVHMDGVKLDENSVNGSEGVREIVDDVATKEDVTSSEKKTRRTQDEIDDIQNELEAHQIVAKKQQRRLNELQGHQETQETISEESEVFRITHEKSDDAYSYESEVKSEYLNLKREFKQAKAQFNNTLELDLKMNGSILKKFGFGRDKMHLQVQEKYDEMMAANNRYLKFAEANGIFDKINERLHRDSEKLVKVLEASLQQADISVEELQSLTSEAELESLAEDKNVTREELISWLEQSQQPYKEYDIRTGILNRHVVNPAQERLAAQTFHMPEPLAKLKNALVTKASKHPNVAKVASVGFGVGMAAVNPFAMVAGFATRYAGDKFFVSKAEAKVQSLTYQSLDNFFNEHSGEVNLDQLEQDYFSGISTVEKYKLRTNIVAVGAAVGAAGGADTFGIDTPLDNIISSDVPNNLPTGEVTLNMPPETGPGIIGIQDSESQLVSEVFDPGVAQETVPIQEAAPVFEVHEVRRYETLSKILLNDLKEAFNAGEVSFPERVTGEGGISGYMYERFPEFTGARGVEATLSPEQWKLVGVSSGDPHLIYPGEKININALVEIMNGGNPSQVLENISWGEIGSVNEMSNQEVPSMLDYDQAPIEGHTTLYDYDVEVIDAGQAEAGRQSAAGLEMRDNSQGEVKASAESSTGSVETSSERFYHMSNYYHELVSEFTKPEPIGRHLLENLHSGLNEGSITMYDFTIDGVDYFDDLEGFINKRLPELKIESNFSLPVEVRVNGVDRAGDIYESVKDAITGEPEPPALTREEWYRLGVPNGDPSEMMKPGNKLLTGRLLEFVITGDKSVLFSKP